jgi:death-on-curing family protein
MDPGSWLRSAHKKSGGDLDQGTGGVRVAKRMTVGMLANEADLDLDEALVALWDAGIDLEDPHEVIPPSQLNLARSAVGIDSPSAQKQVAYWEERLSTDRAGLQAVLAEVGISLPPKARVLPKGALRRLRRRYEFTPTIAETKERSSSASPETEPLQWVIVGQPRRITHLTRDDVESIHWALVEDFALADDPISPPGLRSSDLLDSALTRPQTSLGDVCKYPSIEMAGAALLHSLVLNHAFHNGNKRTGLVSMLVFLDRNNVLATCDDSELFRFVLKVAAHGLVPLGSKDYADHEVLEIAYWIRRNSRQITKGERPLPWLRLKRILRSFGCEFDSAQGVGNRLNIRRTVTGPKRLVGKPKKLPLSTQVHYGDDGREVDRNTLHKIRQELQLDEEHGYDSAVFYESESEPSDFIQQYRMLLRRLGRL